MKPTEKDANSGETPNEMVFDGMPGAAPYEDEDLDTLDAGDDFNPDAQLEEPAKDEDDEEGDGPQEPEADGGQEEEGGAPEGEKPDDGEAEGTTDEGGEESADGTTDVDATREPEEDASEGQGETLSKKNNIMVPKHRLDETLAKLRLAQERLNHLDSKPETEASNNEPEFDFTAAELNYQEALMDGRNEDAAKLRADMRDAEREALRKEVEKTVRVAGSTTRVEDAMKTAASEIEALYPQLDETNEAFSRECLDEVTSLRDAFIIKGTQPLIALQNAVRFVVQDRGLTPAVDEAPQSEATKKNDELSQRRKSTIKDKLRAADKQPPELDGSGNRGRDVPEVDISKMSDDEFNALPEATLKRLQGDFG